MSPSKHTTPKTGVLPRYTPMIPMIAAEPTLSNMLGLVMSAAGLQGRGDQVQGVRRSKNQPIRRPYLISDS